MKRYNGGGSIFKIGGKVKRRKPWRVRVTIGWNDNGKQLFKDLGCFPTRKEAENCLNEYLKNDYNVNFHNITLSEVYDKWIAVFKNKVSDAGLNHHKTVFKIHLKPLHNLPMKDVRNQQILQVMTGKTANVQKRILITLRYLFEWSIINDVNVRTNYAALIKVGDADLVEGKSIERKPFTDEEVRELWKYEGQQYYDITLILLYTGMRISELLELPTASINLKKNKLVGGKKTKAGIDRTIPIHPTIKPILERYVAKGKPFLFYNTKGKPLIYKVFREAWIKFDHFKDRTVHETRHTFITKLRHAQVNKRHLQMVIGHDFKEDSTEIYNHIKFEDLWNVVIKLEY